MSATDRDHWQAVQHWRERSLSEVDGEVYSWLSWAGSAVGAGLAVVPGASGLVDVVARVAGLAGAVDRVIAETGRALGITDHVVAPLTDHLGEVGVRLGHVGLHAGSVVGAYRRAGHDVSRLSDVATLEVDDVLAVRPAIARGWMLAAAVQGALSTLLAGLAAVAARHAALRVTALVVGHTTDTVLIVATCTRAVAQVGAYYGYDPATDAGRERAIALAVLAVCLQTGAGRQDADRTLRELQTGGPVPQRQVSEVTVQLGARLRGRDAAHSVPTLGPGLGVALTARLVARVLDDADRLYRERFLRDKYGLGPVGPVDTVDTAA